jgi:ABC-type branched-subunit amino acid transport system ATPase component
MELFDSLTVWENVAMGQEAAMADARPWRHLVARRSQTVRIRQRAAEAMESCGISHLSDKRPANLSTGQRRLVELARVMAGDYRVLLLDEPSSGLDHHESESFGDILRGLVDDHGVAMLVVEHDMSLVMRVCDYIYVLDFGVPIFDGTPEAVTASSEVRSAYLGSDAVEAAVSERT